MEFRWNEWNAEHVLRHGVSPQEAEQAASRADRPFPRAIGEGKHLVWGPTWAGRLLQVIFELDPERTIYIIHARPLNDSEKGRYRRLRRRR